MNRLREVRDIFQNCHTNKFEFGYSMIYAKVPQDIQYIFEIGVANGPSMKAWLELFPVANIFGLDINPNYKSEHKSIRIITCDVKDFTFQNNRPIYSDSTWFHGDIKFDLVIDDGSHQVEDILHGWDIISPKCSGLYVVEDIETSEDTVKIMEVMKRTSKVVSAIQCSLHEGSTAIIASFDRVIQW